MDIAITILVAVPLTAIVTLLTVSVGRIKRDNETYMEGYSAGYEAGHRNGYKQGYSAGITEVVTNDGMEC